MKTEKHLKGLEINKREYKSLPAVQIFFTMLICMIIALTFKMCTDKPERIPLSVLNAPRR